MACRVRPRRVHRAQVMLWLVLAVALLGNRGDSYLGISWDRPSSTRIPTTLRAQSDRPSSKKKGRPEGKDAEARKLTSRMKGAKSAEEFLSILGPAVDGPTFNYFHASSAYHRLATWKRKGQLPKTAAGRVLLKLSARVGEMIGEEQLDVQGLANVLWSLGYLFDKFPDTLDLVPSIVAQIPLQAKDMKPRELSNILWAAANLKNDAPDVLDIVPSIVAQIPVKAKDTNAQDLSNNLWAAAKLKDEAPDVLDMVPSIVAQVPFKAIDMIPQHLSNSLWAAASLKDDAPDVLDMAPSIVAQIPFKAKDMNAKDISQTLEALVTLQDLVPGVESFLVDRTASSNAFVEVAASRMVKLIPKLKGLDLLFAVPSIVWATASLNMYHNDLLTTVAKHLGTRKRISSLSAWSLCALYGSYQILDPSGNFKFSEMLKKELTKRMFSESDVGRSLQGPLEWTRMNS